MTMKTIYDLRVVTPLHIGNGEQLQPLEFIYTKGWVHVLDEEKFLAYLDTVKATDDFLAWLAGSDRRRGISAFVRRCSKVKERDIISNCVAYRVATASEPRNVRKFIKTYDHRPYIPGSSIKGALRNAILYCILKDAEGVSGMREYVDTALKKLQAQKQSGKRIGRKQEREFGKKLEYQYLRGFQFGPQSTDDDAHSDIFSCIEVSDSSPLESDSLEIRQISVLGSSRSIPIWAEVLRQNVTTRFYLTIDEERLEAARRYTGQKERSVVDLVIKYVSDPIAAMRAFAQDCFAYEKETVKNLNAGKGTRIDPFSRMASSPGFRIGWGGGLIGSTVSLLLDEEARGRMLGFFKPASRPRAPKTRKIVEGLNLELGWASVKKVD